MFQQIWTEEIQPSWLTRTYRDNDKWTRNQTELLPRFCCRVHTIFGSLTLGAATRIECCRLLMLWHVRCDMAQWWLGSGLGAALCAVLDLLQCCLSGGGFLSLGSGSALLVNIIEGSTDDGTGNLDHTSRPKVNQTFRYLISSKYTKRNILLSENTLILSFLM